MIDRVNNIIEANLQLLLKSKNNSLCLNDFKDDFGNKLQDAKTLAKLMQTKKMITKSPGEGFCYQLTEFGREICENGGWLAYLKKPNGTERKKVFEEKTELKKSKKNCCHFFKLSRS